VTGFDLKLLHDFLDKVLNDSNKEIYTVNFEDRLDQIEVATTQSYPKFEIGKTGEITFHAKYIAK